MATVIGVGMQMTANASGMTKGLSDADKALQLLQKIVEQNQQGLRQFAGEADKTTDSIEKLNRNVSTLSTIEIGRTLASGFQALSSAFTSAAQNVLTLAGNVSQSLDSLNDLSARTGIGVEALQGYTLAAKMAGVDTEAFGAAVQKLGVNVAKATPGDALDKSLREINLSVAELQALAPEQQFAAIGDAISVLPTAADRAAAAVAVFGKQGAALAPLFREGAASIEELQARAERLGIIVSETQVNNVANMNDAFDLVRATIEGIIGQVVGNLAPAVTAVTNEFLRFVEEWSGAQGQGGEGIANAITDVLLQGAEVFAGVFDNFVGNFDGISQALADTGEVLQFVGNILTAASESFRIVFNVFESIGNGIVLGLGKVLEGIGSYLDWDLEQFGRDLQASARDALEQNNRDLEAAATNAAQAVQNAFTGGETSPEAGGAGAATEFVRGMREQIERERSPQFQVETNIEQTRDRFDSFFNGIIDQESAITKAMREFEAVVASVADPLNVTREEMQRIEEAQRNVNTLIDEEQRRRQAAAEASRQQADADTRRINSLLQTNDAISRLEDDLAAVERERQRLAGANGEDAQQRLAQLDALQAKLENQQQALEQGFGQGFEQAFEGANNAIDVAIQKAGEFGQAGFNAAQQLAAGIAEAQRQAEAGILNKKAFDDEVARQQQLFEQRLDNEKKIAAERNKAQDEAQKAILKQQEDAARALQEQERAIAQEQARIAEENRKAAEAEFNRQQERIRQLNTLGERTVNTSDVRTAEGSALVLNLAASAQDPALIEARLQTKQLQLIAQGITQAAANYFKTPVAIVGYSSLGNVVP